MSRVGRLLPAILALFCSFACPDPEAHAKALQPGDFLTMAALSANPAQNAVLRIVPATGLLDTVLVLPAGVQARGITLSAQDHQIFLLSSSAIHRVDPCLGTVTTLPNGGFFPAGQNAEIVAHSNGSLYWTKGTGQIIRTDRNTGASSELVNVFTAHGVAPMGIIEGDDNQLYVATATSGNALVPWAVRVDPNTGASSVYARFAGNNTNVRDVAFDTRDSLYVYKIGFEHIIYRTDPVAQLAGPLLTVPNPGGVWGFAGHPDGGLYYLPVVLPNVGVSRVDPVTKAVSVVVPPQGTWSLFNLALVRTGTTCVPTASSRSTWGKVKALYK